MDIKVFDLPARAKGHLEMPTAAFPLLWSQQETNWRTRIGPSPAADAAQSADFIMVAKPVKGDGSPQFSLDHALNKA